jgi:hypothetical protein
VGLSLCQAKRTQVVGQERGAVAILYGHYGPLSGARPRWSDAAGTTDGPVFRHIWKAPDRDRMPAPPVISSQPGRSKMAAMGEVHQLILREGIENARRFVGTRAERQALEAALPGRRHRWKWVAIG